MFLEVSDEVGRETTRVNLKTLKAALPEEAVLRAVHAEACLLGDDVR